MNVATAPQRGAFLRGVLASYGDVSHEFSRRATDASRLTFPLKLVLIIGGGIVATTGAYWLSNFQVRNEMSAIRSDMRDIKTTMEGLKSFQASQIESLQRENEDLKRKEALDAVRLEETRVLVAEIKGFMDGRGFKELSK